MLHTLRELIYLANKYLFVSNKYYEFLRIIYFNEYLF